MQLAYKKEITWLYKAYTILHQRGNEHLQITTCDKTPTKTQPKHPGMSP